MSSELNTPRAPSGPERILDVVRRDTAAPSISWVWRFVNRSGTWRLQVYAWRSFGWYCLILADLGRYCWNLFFGSRCKTKNLQTSTHKRRPKTSTNPLANLTQLQHSDPEPIRQNSGGHLGPKVLDTRIVHTSGKMFDWGGIEHFNFGGRKIFLKYVPINRKIHIIRIRYSK